MARDFTLFSVGPVEIDPAILEIGSKSLPYFRTEEFSKINLEICDMLKDFVHTAVDSKVALLTSSGTAAMEAAVINAFSKKDKVLVIAGGSFGDRFAKICQIHKIDHEVLKLKQGQNVTEKQLQCYKGKGFTGLLVNAHETSTGVYYDLDMIGRFCRDQNLIFVVDAISTFLADDYYMDQWGIDITILSTQKALALPPGVSVLLVNKKTAEKIISNDVLSLYFNLKDYFTNMERGQTPYTPAVGILLQLRARVEQIRQTGVAKIIQGTKDLADDFRERIKHLPFTIPSERLSNALTPLQPRDTVSAHEIFIHLSQNYNIFVCPNGGDLKDRLFRVGHMGYLSKDDNEKLIEAFEEMKERDII